jgi:hypothetical protein
MAKLGASQLEFDVWFKGKLPEFQGMDPSQPPLGPMPELYLDNVS